MGFFRLIECAINEGDIKEKSILLSELQSCLDAGDPGSEGKQDMAERAFRPFFLHHCQVVSPPELRKPKRLHTVEGRTTLVHALCHIEATAIDLALYHCLSFPGQPLSFYRDWLRIAAEELHHFELLAELLKELGAHYGCLPVHDGLWQAALSSNELITRMALVPRYLEAKGLDASLKLQLQMSVFADGTAQNIVSALRRILNDEIGHVERGDFYFRDCCRRENVHERVYFDIVERHYPGRLAKQKHMNIEARLKAGFTFLEIEQILAMSTSSQRERPYTQG